MKNNNIFATLGIFTITLFLTLMGCTTAAPIPTIPEQTISIVNTSTATLIPFTPTSIPPTQTSSATPGLTPSPSSTPISTPSIEPTATETPYAIPTPPGEGATDQVLWLLETNNGCQLPCWWGMVPGQTEWETSEKLLSLFDENIYTASDSEFVFYVPLIPLPTRVFETDEVQQFYRVEDGIVVRIDTLVSIGDTPDGYLNQYTLPSFLSTYGQPSEVWLSTYSSAFENDDLPFFVVMFYPEQGIVASYSDNGIVQGNSVQGCPQADPVSYLILFVPNSEQTFEEVIDKTSALAERKYLSLEESTDMDVATFYETFKNLDNTTCLETPASLWR